MLTLRGNLTIIIPYYRLVYERMICDGIHITKFARFLGYNLLCYDSFIVDVWTLFFYLLPTPTTVNSGNFKLELSLV